MFDNNFGKCGPIFKFFWVWPILYVHTLEISTSPTICGPTLHTLEISTLPAIFYYSRDKMGINGHLTTFSLIFSLKYQTL